MSPQYSVRDICIRVVRESYTDNNFITSLMHTLPDSCQCCV